MLRELPEELCVRLPEIVQKFRDLIYFSLLHLHILSFNVDF
jgi:hypothetical protein